MTACLDSVACQPQGRADLHSTEIFVEMVVKYVTEDTCAKKEGREVKNKKWRISEDEQYECEEEVDETNTDVFNRISEDQFSEKWELSRYYQNNLNCKAKYVYSYL